MATMNRRQAICGICALAGAAAVQNCAVNPVTGRREFVLISEEEEIEIGRQSHGQIINQFGVYEDRELQSWVSNVGARMAQITERPDLPWNFTVINSPVVNAFALPGGYIYFTRGIMPYFNNEAQFAGVMGHEIGHVTARHAVVQISRAQLANLGLLIAGAISPTFRRYSQVAEVGIGLLFLRYSRDNERESDDLGVRYSSTIGYDARELAGFFRTIDRLSPQDGAVPSWLSTHPNPGERERNVIQTAEAFQEENPGVYAVNRQQYIRRVEGVVYGDDPRYGYVDENAYYNPNMRLTFPTPSDWETQNSPAEVRMAPKGGQSLLVFNVLQADSITNAAERFTKVQNIQVTERRAYRVEEMEYLNLIGTIGEGGQTVEISSFYTELGGRFLSFHGLCDRNRLNRYQQIYQNTAHNLRPLTDQSRINVFPDRVAVRPAPISGPLSNSLSRLGIDDKRRAQENAVLNGMELGQNIDSGTLLKIVSD